MEGPDFAGVVGLLRMFMVVLALSVAVNIAFVIYLFIEVTP
jgi:hypothetical protein